MNKRYGSYIYGKQWALAKNRRAALYSHKYAELSGSKKKPLMDFISGDNLKPA